MTYEFFASPNVNERFNGQSPSIIILHYTGTVTSSEAHDVYMMADRVSPHYMVDRDGTVLQYVAENKRAWHAGKSFWRSDVDINSSSIGIEVVNSGHEHELEPFPDVQIQSLISLLHDIRSRWDIPNKNILGHSDIAVGRKIDPGEHFPWDVLHDAGIGILPASDHAEMVDDVDKSLTLIGFDPSLDLAARIKEFRRHYMRHSDLNAGADDELRRAISSILHQSA